jgi:hypothetical protein
VKKLEAAKNKIRPYIPHIIAITSAIVATAVVFQTKKEATTKENEFRAHEEELLNFLGNGPDFIAIDQKLADRIESGETFGHDLVGGTRVLLSRAEPKKD